MQLKDKELFDACKKLSHKDTQRLLEEGIGPDIVDEEGNTPLFYAVINSDFDSVNLLYTAGANINIKNKHKQTPLIYLYHRSHELYLYQLLLAKGANPYIKDIHGATLFDLAQDTSRRPLLGILKEWEHDNWEMVAELKKKAQEPDPEPKLTMKDLAAQILVQESIDKIFTDEAIAIRRRLN
jgi:ankyrin repeat protein